MWCSGAVPSAASNRSRFVFSTATTDVQRANGATEEIELRQNRLILGIILVLLLGAYTTNSDGSGDAAFVMKVTGSKTTGQYKVEMRRSNSVWKIVKGDVSLANGEVIDIVDQSGLDTGPDLDANENSTPTPPLPGDSRSSGRTISGGVLNGKATSLPQPPYPPAARQVKASGTVMVQVLVDEKGNVVIAQAVTGHPLLRPAAVAAARQAKFSPTRLSGKPVKVSGVINYQFTPE